MCRDLVRVTPLKTGHNSMMFTLHRGITMMKETIAWCDWAIAESRRLSRVALLRIQSQPLTHTAGDYTATVSFRPRPPLELYFATDTFAGWWAYGKYRNCSSELVFDPLSREVYTESRPQR